MPAWRISLPSTELDALRLVGREERIRGAVFPDREPLPPHAVLHLERRVLGGALHGGRVWPAACRPHPERRARPRLVPHQVVQRDAELADERVERGDRGLGLARLDLRDEAGRDADRLAIARRLMPCRTRASRSRWADVDFLRHRSTVLRGMFSFSLRIGAGCAVRLNSSDVATDAASGSEESDEEHRHNGHERRRLGGARRFRPAAR